MIVTPNLSHTSTLPLNLPFTLSSNLSISFSLALSLFTPTAYVLFKTYERVYNREWKERVRTNLMALYFVDVP